MSLVIDIRKRVGSIELQAKLEAPPGVTVIFGPSGSGKTTLLRCIEGSLRPDAGRIVLGEETLFDAKASIDVPPHRRGTPQVYQEGRLFPHLEVRSNLLFGHRGGDPSLTEVARLLEIEGLLTRRIDGLSGGERQRVALGRALLAQPKALLMDEPLAALDRELRQRILPYLARVRDQLKVPLLYVTHSLDEAFALGQQVVRFDRGRLIDAGRPEQVLAHATVGALAPSRGRDTIFAAEIDSHDPGEGITICRLGNARLSVPLQADAPGTRVFFGLSAADTVLARSGVEGLSARNQLRGTVGWLLSAGSQVRVSIEPAGAPQSPALETMVTPAAVRELSLEPGSDVVAVFKTSSLRRLTH